MAKSKKTMEDDEVIDRSPGIGMLYGEVDTDIVAGLTHWIISENLADNPPDMLTLLINSPGGSLSDAFCLIEIMNGSKIPVQTVALGEVCSAGLLIFMSGHPGHRVITPTCSVMSHHFSAGTGGNYHDLINVQREWNFTNQRIINQYKQCTGLTEEEIKLKLLPPTDVFLTPSQAVEYGLADKIKGLGASPTE